MSEITKDKIVELREKTSAGLVDCKRALTESGGDMDEAVSILRKKGVATAAKKAGRDAAEGVISCKLSENGRSGVIIEVNCETDFVAKNPEFQQLARDLAMHIASAAPLAVSAENVPAADVERERQVYLAQVTEEGKPENIREKIVEGKLSKWFKNIKYIRFIL